MWKVSSWNTNELNLLFTFSERYCVQLRTQILCGSCQLGILPYSKGNAKKFVEFKKKITQDFVREKKCNILELGSIQVYKKTQ